MYSYPAECSQAMAPVVVPAPCFSFFFLPKVSSFMTAAGRCCKEESWLKGQGFCGRRVALVAVGSASFSAFALGGPGTVWVRMKHATKPGL